MDKISQFITPPIRKQDAPKSQWQDLVSRFTHQYNLKANRPMSVKRMAMILATIKTLEGLPYLEYFFDECMKADNFGKFFNYKISTKRK